MTRDRHLFGKVPKFVLALDGGGVRGVVTLAFLERIEALLAEHYGTGEDFRLSDHFALIGGTSTGSIIATGLALGHSVAHLTKLYTNLSADAFAKVRWFGGVIAPKFPAQPLTAAIGAQIGDSTLGSDQLRCGLGIVAKRLDSNSVWVFHNHPNGPYFTNDGGDIDFVANSDLPLVNLIRASTAAPTYFEPEFIRIAPGVEGAFVDGGVSPHNNPSLAMFMLATIKGYGFCWPMGLDRLHILSIGTGNVRPQLKGKITPKTLDAGLAFASVKSLMSDCDSLVQALMQWMGQSHMPSRINGEIGDLSQDQIGAMPLFRYTRFNIDLERQWLIAHLGRDFDDKTLRGVARMDEPRAIDDLLSLGRQAAQTMVKLDALLLRAA